MRYLPGAAGEADGHCRRGGGGAAEPPADPSRRRRHGPRRLGPRRPAPAAARPAPSPLPVTAPAASGPSARSRRRSRRRRAPSPRPASPPRSSRIEALLAAAAARALPGAAGAERGRLPAPTRCRAGCRRRTSPQRAVVLREEVERERRAMAELRRRAETLEANNRDVARFYREVVGGRRIGLLPVLAGAGGHGRELGLQSPRRNYAPKEVKGVAGLSRFQVTMPVTGTYRQLGAFLGALGAVPALPDRGQGRAPPEGGQRGRPRHRGVGVLPRGGGGPCGLNGPRVTAPARLHLPGDGGHGRHPDDPGLAPSLPMARITRTRTREIELRRELRTMRTAIDKYQQAVAEGKIGGTDVKLGSEGYPPDLETLVEGVTQVGRVDGLKLKFLRRVPIDPMTGTTEWGMRCYQDEPDERLLVRAERLGRLHEEPGQGPRRDALQRMVKGAVPTGRDGERGFTLLELITVVVHHRDPDRHRPAQLQGRDHPGQGGRAARGPVPVPGPHRPVLRGQGQVPRVPGGAGGAGLPAQDPGRSHDGEPRTGPSSRRSRTPTTPTPPASTTSRAPPPAVSISGTPYSEW